MPGAAGSGRVIVLGMGSISTIGHDLGVKYRERFELPEGYAALDVAALL